MLNIHSRRNLLGLKEVSIVDTYEFDDYARIDVKLKRKAHVCPCCKRRTRRIHDYRKQIIKHTSVNDKPLIICLNKRRYRCSCGKRFYENVDFLPKYHRMTRSLIDQILKKLKDVRSFKSVATNGKLSYGGTLNIDYTIIPNTLGIDMSYSLFIHDNYTSHQVKAGISYKF